MRILQGLAGLRQLPAGCVLSIGNFDGVHRGHAGILGACEQLRAAGPTAAMGGSSSRPHVAVVTFEPHPLTVLRPELAPPRLTPPALKATLLEAKGVDDLVVLPPADEVLNLSAEDFWRLLRDGVRPAHLVEGESFTFGRGRGGTIGRLREWSHGTGIELHVVDPVRVALLDMQLVPVSSSLVRWLIAQGRARDAGICLGRAYALHGQVVEGHHRGRTIGVPTANLRVDAGQMLPPDAVYAGRCAVDGTTYPAAVSIGTMPTFGANVRQVEAHLLGFSGDLYGRTLTLELLDWVREQARFSGVEALKAQLARDIRFAGERATTLRAGEPIASTS